MRIGYQGIVGSNSEEAAKLMAERLEMKNVEFVPLVSSKKVIGSLKRNEIDYAVVAVKNSIGGTVKETFDAIKNQYIELVATEILPIHHCLFKKNEKINTNDLKYVASHIQALKQTKESRAKKYSHLEEKEIEDTAIGAVKLAEGSLAEDVAVVCRKNAGLDAGLILIEENIEDTFNNMTEFRMFKNPEIDYFDNTPPAFLQRIKYSCINEQGIGFLSKVIIILSVFISFYISKFFNWSEWETATFVGGYISVIILFLASNKLQNKFKFEALKGYWKYYSIAENAEDNIYEQKYDVPRIVEIDEIDGELVFKGYICDEENIPFFETTSVIISPLHKSKGNIVYWYANPTEMNRGFTINGIVELYWKNKIIGSNINKMTGHYMGRATREVGNVEYIRITKKEYDVHRHSDFL